MGATAQNLAPCLRGTPEDAECSAAPLTPPPSGATQLLLSINLSLKPPSIPSLKKSFLRGCSRRSMLPHHGRLCLLRTEWTSCIDAPPNVISCSTYLQSAHSLSPQHTKQPCCLQCSEVCSYRGMTTPVFTRKVHVENNGFLCCIVLVDFARRYFS